MHRFTGQQLADIAGVEGITFRRFVRRDGTRVANREAPRARSYRFDRDEARAYLAAFLDIELTAAEQLLADAE
jgi:hypothetical protein